MKLLFLSPQPFFQERGTPIAVRLALEVLTERTGRGHLERLDFLCYNEGQKIELQGVCIQRIWQPKLLQGIGPGVSFKKLICDIIFLCTALRLVWQKRKNQYDLVHAVEESVFIAWIIRQTFGVPYIYDMDSSLALQLTEKWSVLRPLLPLFSWFEKLAVRGSQAVVPVCDALAAIAVKHGSRFTSVLSDVSLLNPDQAQGPSDLRTELGLSRNSQIVMYIGNLEKYQGIDLLLESFALAAKMEPHAQLVIIGGQSAHIAQYQALASELGISTRTHLVGPRPVQQLDQYIMQADILVSPRIRGNNTPMKIYSYLHSGRAILATRLFTHTQVLNQNLAQLCEPTPQAFSEGMLKLLIDREQRQRLGQLGREFAEKHYTFERFREKLNLIYDQVDREVLPNPQHSEAGGI